MTDDPNEELHQKTDYEVVLGTLMSVLRESDKLRQRLNFISANLEQLQGDYEKILKGGLKVLKTYTTGSFFKLDNQEEKTSHD